MFGASSLDVHRALPLLAAVFESLWTPQRGAAMSLQSQCTQDENEVWKLLFPAVLVCAWLMSRRPPQAAISDQGLE